MENSIGGRETYQCSINFVHNVQRSGLVVMKSKHQSQRRQSLFPTRKVTDVLPNIKEF